MSTPNRTITSTTAKTTTTDRVRSRFTRPGLAFAAVAALGFGLAGATAGTASAAEAAAPNSPGLTGFAQSASGGDGRSRAADPPADRDGDDDKRSARERDKRSDQDRDRKARPKWVSPMQDAKTTSCFGPRWGTHHAGLDLAEPENAPVNAAGAGTVIAAGWIYQGYGISVVIDHGDGHLTHYAHLNRTSVKPGDKVDPGDRIGLEGNTGDSTGPHLHFEVHKGMWNQVDPGPWMKSRGVDLKC